MGVDDVAAGVDARLDPIVLRALEKDPPARYQHASSIKTDVDRVAHEPAAPRGVEQPLEPLDVVIPSTPEILSADRRGEPLDRAIAPEVWDAVETLVDALDSEVVSIT